MATPTAVPYPTLANSPVTAMVPEIGDQPGPAIPAAAEDGHRQDVNEPTGLGLAGSGGDRPEALTVADGVTPDGATVFDDEYPAVANLQPDLLLAFRAAATDAAADGVTIVVNSGWRSPAYQDRLLHDAIAEYGAAAEAARWVATAQTSPHVAGAAVDIGPDEAIAWLAVHGSAYGLCQIYGNVPWHYEYRPAAVNWGCPLMYADPTRDPRMAR